MAYSTHRLPVVGDSFLNLRILMIRVLTVTHRAFVITRLEANNTPAKAFSSHYEPQLVGQLRIGTSEVIPFRTKKDLFGSDKSPP